MDKYSLWSSVDYIVATLINCGADLDTDGRLVNATVADAVALTSWSANDQTAALARLNGLGLIN